MALTPEELGARLLGRRTERGLSQTELARLAQVSTRTIREIEHGRARSPHSPSVIRLIETLEPQDEPPPPAPDTGRIRLDVLGPVDLQVAGQHVEFGTAMQSCLLALLGLQPGTPVTRDEIVDVLWDSRPPATCLNMVHTYVSRLRRLLAPANRPEDGPGGVLRRTRTGYLLRLDEEQSDAARFTALAALVPASPATATRETYTRAGAALRLWRGAVARDAPARVRRHPAAVALAQLRVSVVQAYADGALAVGAPQDAVHELQKVADLEPLHEGVHARLMLALAGGGRRAASLQLFTTLRDRLDDQLGIRPGQEVTDAHVRVLRMDLPLPPAAPERLVVTASASASPVTRPAPAAPPASLPYDAAFFTGRADQLARLDDLLAEAGPHAGRGSVICALTGPAGAGKTALAVHWAHRMRDRFPDGQLFVDLRGHSARSPVRPVEALARLLLALGVVAERIPGTAEAAADLYRSISAGRRMLVVLDNAADAEHVRPLLPGGPGCVVLVTSRDRLTGLAARDGARRIGLDVLAPEEARLLLSRTLGAARVEADPRAAADLARACGHLPLALRICAANLDNNPWRTLREQTEELCDGDRLTVLSVAGDRATAVRNAFALSYDALEAPVRRMFRLLALLPGPETGLPAAAVAAGTTVQEAARLLERLTAAHLLSEHQPGRYRLHDLIALYAAERLRLEETDAVRLTASDALYAWLLAAVNRCARLLYPGMQQLLPGDTYGARGDAVAPLPEITHGAAAIRWLDAELPNLAAAVHQAAAAGHPAAWLLADALRGHSWSRKNTVDWTALGQAALVAARAAAQPRAEGAAHNLVGIAHTQQSRPDTAIAHFEQFLVLAESADWPEGAATAHTNLSMVTRISGQLRRSADHLERAMELDRQGGLPDGHPAVLGNLANVLRDLGRLSESLDCFLQAERLPADLDNQHNQLHRQANLGRTRHLLGDPAGATHHLRTALTMARQWGDQGSEAYVLRLTASVRRDAGDLTGALELARTATALSDQDGDEYFRAAARITLGSVLLALGRHDEASGSYQEAAKLARDRGAHDLEARSMIGLASLHRPLEHEQATAALHIARRTEYRLVEGEALTALARAGLERGEPAAAADHARQALAVHRSTGHRQGQALALELLGRAADTTGEEDPTPYWRESLEIFDTLGAPGAARLRQRLAATPGRS